MTKTYDEKEFDRQLRNMERRDQYLDQNGISGEDDQLKYIRQGVFSKEVDVILWKKLTKAKKGSDEEEDEEEESDNEEECLYLVKFKNKSYLHCEWVTEEFILQDPKGKAKLKRFNKTFQRKIDEGEIYSEDEEIEYFDPTLVEVDRIIQCVEMFPVIHPKKANDNKGKWSELIVLFVQKLLNYTKDSVNYGTFLMEPVVPERDGCRNYRQVINNPMDLGTLSNKIYLDCFQEYDEFLDDLGLVFKNCRKYNQNPKSEIRIICDTLREVAVVLYGQWYDIQQGVYKQLKCDFEDMCDPIKARRREEERRIEYSKTSQIRIAKLIRKLTSLLDRDAYLKDEMRSLICEFGEEINGSMILRGMELKEEKEIKAVISVYLQANKSNIKDEECLIVGSKLDGDTNMKRFIDGIVLGIKNSRKKSLNLEEIEQFNPQQRTLSWLCDNMQDNPNILEYLEQEDMDNIKFDGEVNMVYLIKWKNMSYSDLTFEFESEILSNIKNSTKINEFRLNNRALDKDSRMIMSRQCDMHKALVELEEDKKVIFKLGGQSRVNDIKNKLYNYDIMKYKQVFQYNQNNQQTYKQKKLLRSYQLESLNWMIDAYYNCRNLILADEMGLGKTIQATAFLNHLNMFEGIQGPFLIISPLSTLEHWKRSIEEWTNLNAILYYDSDGHDGRTKIRQYEFNHTDISTKGTMLQASLIYKFNVLITSNEVFLSDLNEFLMNIPFQFIIIDEAHKLKNQQSRMLTSLKRLPCKRILLMTGTPVQNNTEELWTLLNFIEPLRFSSLVEFKRAFGDLKDKDQVDILQATIKPFLLRRMKEDVEDSIPPLQETIIDIEMTNIQKTLYKAIYEKNKSMLLKSFSSSAVMTTQLNNLAMQLRRCCNHPFLIDEIEEELTEDCHTTEERLKKLVDSSGKMILLDKLLVKYKKEGKKLLIFSQFLAVLGLLEEYLSFKNYRYEKIDGSVKSRDRQNAIDRFNDPEKKRDVFLLSTKAGGMGINLTSANVVIIFDSDWNPQNDVQACARAHRIGQKYEVCVYRFITKNSYESEMFEKATKKLGLGQAIFMGGEFKSTGSGSQLSGNGSTKLDKKDIENLLKKGILGLLNEADSSKQFQEEDIDQILKQSRIGKFSVINGQYTFSKGSFVSNKTDSELKLDDPNFWNKVLKDKESKTLKALKELQEKKQTLVESKDEQKKYFFQVCSFVNEIIAAKLNLQGFNADDEKNVVDILNSIQSSKFFPKKYKDIAINLQFELARPSRRFKKITIFDLNLESSQKKKIKDSPKKKEKEENALFFDDSDDIVLSEEDKKASQSDDNKSSQENENREEVKSDKKQNDSKSKSGVTQAKGEQTKDSLLAKTKEKQKNKPKGQDKAKAQADKPKATEEEESNSKSILSQNLLSQGSLFKKSRQEDLFKRLCYCCDRPNCTHFCTGFCRRAFHPECRQSIEAGWVNEEGLPNEAREVIVGEDKSRLELEQSLVEFKCSDCSENLQICFVCKKKDTYFQQNSKTPKDNNKTMLSKCFVSGCHKFFHLSCIKGKELFKQLDKTNARVKCSLHYCLKCKASSEQMPIMQCIRCFRAYHNNCLSGIQVLRLAKRVMLCEIHVNDSLHNDKLIEHYDGKKKGGVNNQGANDAKKKGQENRNMNGSKTKQKQGQNYHEQENNNSGYEDDDQQEQENDDIEDGHTVNSNTYDDGIHLRKQQKMNEIQRGNVPPANYYQQMMMQGQMMNNGYPNPYHYQNGMYPPMPVYPQNMVYAQNGYQHIPYPQAYNNYPQNMQNIGMQQDDISDNNSNINNNLNNNSSSNNNNNNNIGKKLNQTINRLSSQDPKSNKNSGKKKKNKKKAAANKNNNRNQQKKKAGDCEEEDIDSDESHSDSGQSGAINNQRNKSKKSNYGINDQEFNMIGLSPEKPKTPQKKKQTSVWGVGSSKLG